MSATPLPLKRSSVPALVTAEEYAQLISELEAVSPLESKGRIRNVTLLAVSVATKLAHAFGRCPRSIAFLCALQTPLPRLWDAQLEQEANRANFEVDLCLDDEIAELEEEDCHLAAELVASHVPYAFDDQDDERAASWRLPSVPAALQAELDALVKFRTEPINRQRDGSCCVDMTVGNDISTCKRFLGWLLAEKEITAGLGVFCRAALGEWVEEYLRALRDKGLKFSTCANYCNSLFMVCSFVYCTFEVDAEALAMNPTPCDELIRLRAQCESQAKHEALYSRRDPNWVDWPDVQKGRVAAEARYKSLPASPHKPKAQALKEWVILALHSCQPPDRVVRARSHAARTPTLPLLTPLLTPGAPVRLRTGRHAPSEAGNDHQAKRRWVHARPHLSALPQDVALL